ncbi:hypothetical protein [Streptomyces decoyicus]|uniref:hypothetical protein n=1 Tax=Streptomyces decoyicus TaxID=249567 RepID=UPI00381140BE
MIDEQQARIDAAAIPLDLRVWEGLTGAIGGAECDGVSCTRPGQRHDASRT